MSDTLTLTARQKARSAARAARLAPPSPPVPASRPASLAPTPQPPSGRVEIEDAPEGLRAILRDGQSILIPETPNGLRILRNILRAHRAAAISHAAPRIGSDCYPTQAQIDAWLKAKQLSTEEISAERKTLHSQLSSDCQSKMGF